MESDTFYGNFTGKLTRKLSGNDSQTLDILCFFPVGFIDIINFQEIFKVCK